MLARSKKAPAYVPSRLSEFWAALTTTHQPRAKLRDRSGKDQVIQAAALPGLRIASQQVRMRSIAEIPRRLRSRKGHLLARARS